MTLAQLLVGICFAGPLVIFSYIKIATDQSRNRSSRKYRRHKVNYNFVIDCRFMVLLAIMIRADLAYIFCNIVKSNISYAESWNHINWFMFHGI